jgi:hypothetical protein
MASYTLFVHDDRYSVPTFYMVSVANDERALELADEKLRSSPHYSRVEVFDGDRLVGAIDRPL